MKRCLATLLILYGLADSSNAAVIHVRPKLAAVLKPDFTPADSSAIKSIQPLEAVRLRPSAAKYVLQFDYLMTIEDLVDGQLGFGNVVCNIDLDGVQQAMEYPGWVPDGPPPFDLDSERPGGLVPKWDSNRDAGLIGADLKLILIESNPKGFFTGNPPGTDWSTDPRLSLGIAPYFGPHLEGEYIGSTFLEIPGTPGIAGLVTATVLEGSTFNAELLLSAVGTTGGPPANFTIEIVPEPSSLGLLSTGAAILLVGCYRWRRCPLRTV
ncbi:MAG: PEP-CTERM sorting domain-containing protein [Planctomycetia bacterium]|nr:PEP-CTERM sorting domain-containing protein [Planctomycetia bacterium]